MDRLLVIESKAPKDEVFLSRTRVTEAKPEANEIVCRDADGNQLVYKCGGKVNALREAAQNALREEIENDGIRWGPFDLGLFWDPIPKNVAIWVFGHHRTRYFCRIKLLNNQLGKELQLYQSGLMHVLGNCGQSTPLFCNLLSKCIHFAEGRRFLEGWL